MDLSFRTIRTWADTGGIPDLALAELDYRLVHALQALCTDAFLRERLCLKGGTALNKLYLSGMDRLSVDLDFNAVGPAEQVLRERIQYSQAVIAALQRQDAGYSLTYRWRYDQVTVYARFAPLSGAGPQTLKVEISFVERFAILGPEQGLLQGRSVRPVLLGLSPPWPPRKRGGDLRPHASPLLAPQLTDLATALGRSTVRCYRPLSPSP